MLAGKSIAADPYIRTETLPIIPPIPIQLCLDKSFQQIQQRFQNATLPAKRCQLFDGLMR